MLSCRKKKRGCELSDLLKTRTFQCEPLSCLLVACALFVLLLQLLLLRTAAALLCREAKTHRMILVLSLPGEVSAVCKAEVGVGGLLLTPVRSS